MSNFKLSLLKIAQRKTRPRYPVLRNLYRKTLGAGMEIVVELDLDSDYRRYVSNLKMNSLPMVFMLGSLLASANFSSAAAVNAALQFVVFVLTANIPAVITGRMSYVDIAWPCGLVIIGLGPLIQGIKVSDFFHEHIHIV